MRFTLILASTPLPFSLRRNAEVREITQLSRQQATKLLSQLRRAGLIKLAGGTKGARWHLTKKDAL